MATVDTQQIQRAGTAPAYSAASGGGDKFRPDERTFLHVKNSDVAAHTVTVATPGTVLGLAVSDVAVSVPAGGERMVGPFPGEHFVGADGLAAVTWSAVTGMTFAVVRV